MHPVLAAAAASGVAAHVLYFRHGEHHLHPYLYIKCVALLFLGSTAGAKQLEPILTIGGALSFGVAVTGSFLGGLYLSLLVYRVLLNPLNKYPGPFFARLSALDFSFRVAGKKDMYHKLYAAHQEQGNFVRTGPNDLSVADPDAIRAAFSPQTTCVKAPWYSIEMPAFSMHTARSRVEHDKRRRIWSPAFSDKALRGYEERMTQYNRALVDHLVALKGEAVDMSKWFNVWSFDVMGDLAFGRSFDGLSHPADEEHWAIRLLNGAQDMIGLAFPPWLNRFLFFIPGARVSYFKFLKFCADSIEDRMVIQGQQKNPDITHYLIEDYNARAPAEKQLALHSLHLDSKLIIVAGSDTTAATLTYLFYHLATEPGLLARVRAEVESLRGENGEIEHRQIQSAPLLNGCINETLRLHPPVPSGLYRKTPPQGMQIGNEWVPGNTTIQIHLYTIGRSEECYTQADKFIPERFFSRPELIKHKDAFSPFSAGPYGCIGKNLAYMEIRLLTAYLVTTFDEVKLAPGEDGSGLLMKTVDRFTVGLAPLELKFIKN